MSMRLVFARGGSVLLNGKIGDATDSKINIHVPGGGDVTLVPLLITNPSNLVHYTATPGSGAVAVADVSKAFGHLYYQNPLSTSGTGSNYATLHLPLGNEYDVNLLVTNASGSGVAGGVADYVQYVIDQH